MMDCDDDDGGRAAELERLVLHCRRFWRYARVAQCYDVSFAGCERHGIKYDLVYPEESSFEASLRAVLPAYQDLARAHDLPADALIDYRMVTSALVHQGETSAHYPEFHAHDVFYDPAAYGPLVNAALAEVDLAIEPSEMPFYFVPRRYARDGAFHLTYVDSDQPFEVFADQVRRLIIHRNTERLRAEASNASRKRPGCAR